MPLISRHKDLIMTDEQMVERKLEKTLSRIVESSEDSSVLKSNGVSDFSKRRAQGELWSRDTNFSVTQALGDATLQDIKSLASRIHNLRGRVSRLTNVVDMIHQIK